MKNSVAGWFMVIATLAGYLEGGADAVLPVSCDHDKMWIVIDPKVVSDEHRVRLEQLGWEPDESFGAFWSYQSA
jgi:hypothetical protein